MNLLLADDHGLFRQGLSLIVKKIFPSCLLQHNNCWTDVHQKIEQQDFDLVLLDIFMPRQHPWEQELKLLLSKNPQLIICIISASTDNEHIQTAFKLGVKGYICKAAEPDELQLALLQVHAGKVYFPPQMRSNKINSQNKSTCNKLTLRQQDILKLVTQGCCNKIISRKLSITESTVKRHLHNTFRILKAKNRTEAVKIARQQCLLSQPH
ncbi:MAG: hypothetical protein DRJ10_06295 [Bacteroidetes bacterium]|nr:MAG: hypothetical protein DRJ10_06295 [Bacteroidota bacterium]